jgi:hypothetical protein
VGFDQERTRWGEISGTIGRQQLLHVIATMNGVNGYVAHAGHAEPVSDALGGNG